MDPDAALRALRDAIQTFRDAAKRADQEGELTGRLLDAADRVADAAEALDGWLSHGGFLPVDWARRWPT